MTRHARELRDALARREAVSDAELDQVFPEELRDRTHLHWTPIAVAVRAAALLAPTPGARILDVGFGWGTTLLHLAERFPDCPRIDGVNISVNVSASTSANRRPRVNLRA